MRGALAWLGIAAVTSGCEPEETRELSVPSVRDAFAASLATIVCERAEACCVTNGHPDPGDACRSNMRNDTYVLMLVADEEQIPLRFEEGEECLDRFRGAPGCDETLLAESLPAVCPELFGEIPAGSGTAGATCMHAYECAEPPDGDRACVPTSTSTSACTWFVPAEAGDACAMDPAVVPVCPEGMGCRPLLDGDAPTCQPRGDYGAACFAADSCGEGLLCSQDVDGTFSCADDLALDDLCDERPDACGASLYCEPASERCRVLPVVAACLDPACPDYALEKICK